MADEDRAAKAARAKAMVSSQIVSSMTPELILVSAAEETATTEESWSLGRRRNREPSRFEGDVARALTGGRRGERVR